MVKRFEDGIDQLIDMVGGGSLRGRVVVDQPYAQIQHERLDFRHPAGGRAKYLERSLEETRHQWMRRSADSLLEGGVRETMVWAVEQVSTRVYQTAPFEFGDLRGSPHPTVFDGRAVMYERLPATRRLTKQQIRTKGQLRDIGLGNHR